MFGKKHSPESIKKMAAAKVGKTLSENTKLKISLSHKGKRPNNLDYLHEWHKGKNHGNWKGNNVKHAALHTWVNRWKMKPKICSNCGANKRLTWANIDHKYRRNLSDYIALCYKCHQDFDKLNNGYPIKNRNQFT